MKVLHHFDDHDGRTLMPGETFKADAYDEAEVESLKERGYIGDGDGFEADKPDFDKMGATDMRAFGRALGLDVTRYHSKADLRRAVAGRWSAGRSAPAAPAEQKAAVITMGPKIDTKVEEVAISPKEGQTTAEAVAEVKAAEAPPAPAPAPAPEPAPAPAPARGRGGAAPAAPANP